MDKRWVNIAIPGYIKQLLAIYQHKHPNKPQHQPHLAPPLLPDNMEMQHKEQYQKMEALPWMIKE